MERKTKPLFVITDYPYGRKHPAMYFVDYGTCASSKWTFNKEKARKFTDRKSAEYHAKQPNVKGVVEECN